MNGSIPSPITKVATTLKNAGYEAYLVGGCVRDMIMGITPKDWDITTNATPEQIQPLFPHSFYTNEFGTVGIVTETEEPTTNVVEVTPYRTEGTYSDKRHPDTVSFGQSLEEDLARRDFTMNAIAYDCVTDTLIDPFKGQSDIKDKIIRTVRNPNERFDEDALRIVRGIRFVSQLGFMLEGETMKALSEKAPNIASVSRERVRDELSKIIMTKEPMLGLVLAQQLGVLQFICHDLTRGVGVEQNQAHSYDVFGHLMRSLQHAADKDFSFIVRLSALFHDISKPETRRFSKEKNDWTFYGHDVVGARVTKAALEDLRFSRETVEKAEKLVRWHMFFSDPDQITLSAVRRVIRNVGEDSIVELLELRMCDRIGTGRPKEQPFRFRKFKAMVDEALRDPISVKMLKVDGSVLMEVFRVKPGPVIGDILNILLEEVLEEPSLNTKEHQLKRSEELLKLSPEELRKLGEKGRMSRDKREEAELHELLDKHHVC
jgi:tRNA nucleotidyltransferase (CCA-adding enzyme)